MKFGFIPYRKDEDYPIFCIDILFEQSGIFSTIMTFEFEGSVLDNCWYCQPVLRANGNLLYISKYVNSIVNRFHKYNPVI